MSTNNLLEEVDMIIKDVQFAVNSISLSKALPQSPYVVFINIETKENEAFTVRLTLQGFLVVSHSLDKDDSHSEKYPSTFETVYALLENISPSYVGSFGQALKDKLAALEQLENVEDKEDENLEVESDLHVFADSYIAETRLDSSDAAYKRHKFNQWISDKLPVDRNVPDTRPRQCVNKNYRRQLASTSVIITFHNEARSALLRTVQSVLSRTPPFLLKEIILVDDHSENEEDGWLLESVSKVKVIRNFKREGLIRSRMIGAKVATSAILTFLDSHCEVNVGWIEPLLYKVLKDPLAISSPIIDIIKMHTLEYKQSSNFLKGGFDWKMHFVWEPLLENEVREQKTDPTHAIRTPVIAGGLFTVRKDWFYQLGQYDPGLEIWGGENFEISFKTWMCGGSLEILPCSRVGHIFRKEHPYNFPKGNGNTYLTNIRRVAEVWMDHYKNIFYRARGGHSNIPLTGIEERKKIRDNLKCRTFDWYLTNVYTELRIPNANEQAYGEMKQSFKEETFCLTKSSATNVLATKCLVKNKAMQWSMSSSGLIQTDSKHCLYASKQKKHITLTECINKDPNQHWKLMVHDRIRHRTTNLCIEKKSNGDLYLSHCNENPRQKWKFTTRFYF